MLSVTWFVKKNMRWKKIKKINKNLKKIALVRELNFLMEESIITDIIAWLRTNQIRLIFST